MLSLWNLTIEDFLEEFPRGSWRALSSEKQRLVDNSVVEMQSGATAPGPGSKHPEQEELFDVFEVRE